MSIDSLPPGKELEALLSLTEGVPFLLKRCDVVSPDSSFILYGTENFFTYGMRSLYPYCARNSKYFHLRRLFDLYVDISHGVNTRINLGEIRDVLDENFLKLDIFFDFLLNDALQRENFMFTEIAYHECRNVCNKLKDKMDIILEKKVDILPPGFMKRKFPYSKYKGAKFGEFQSAFGGYGKTISHLNKQDLSAITQATEILDEIVKRLKGDKDEYRKIKTIGLDDIFDFVFKNKKILPSEGRFDLRENCFDEDIIDTTLSNGEKVGIISCDYKHFRQKIPRVMEVRRQKLKLLNQEVFLLEPRRGLRGYDLSNFSVPGVPPIYLKRENLSFKRE